MYKYLHFSLFGPRNSEWEQVSSTLRLGEKVRIEIILVLDFKDLKKTLDIKKGLSNKGIKKIHILTAYKLLETIKNMHAWS